MKKKKLSYNPFKQPLFYIFGVISFFITLIFVKVPVFCSYSWTSSCTMSYLVVPIVVFIFAMIGWFFNSMFRLILNNHRGY